MMLRPRSARRRACLAVGVGVCSVVLLAACSLPERPASARNSKPVNAVVSTEILADLVKNVGGERINVETVIPHGGDPHSFEPSPKDARTVAGADVAFTNHLLLEEHAMIKMFDSNVPDDVPNISLAEHAEQYGARLIPLVEDVDLDTIWLGLAVRGTAPNRSDDIVLRATALEGPGDLSVYLTETLGEPEKYFVSADGLTGEDVVALPPDAHTHLNWAFTKPGEYRLTFAASLRSDGVTTQVGTGTFTFAVGIDPQVVAEKTGASVLDGGHTDLTVDLDTRTIVARSDGRADLAAARTVISVPDVAIEEVPKDSRFRFIGAAGAKVWQLPQAVLGKHVHGEIDPHLWEDVRNAKAYVHAIAATLAVVDPDGRRTYERNRDSYSQELDVLHQDVTDTIAMIPREKRQLVTTHDAFGYLAKAYGMTVAGFVVPNPAQEPSAAQVRDLTRTVRELKVSAVFVEPNLARRAAVLQRVATDAGVRICLLHGDTFSPQATDYIQMMRWNAHELQRCLTKESP